VAKPARKLKPAAPKEPLPLWQEAASFAARAHRHQLRKDGRTPYVAHVFRVTMTLVTVFGCTDEAVITASLLHDTIEDTTTDYDDLRERFGADVADCVAALTKNMAMPEAPREREYDARIAKADWRVRLIKLADTYDNYCDVETFPPEARAAKRTDALDKCRRAIVLARADAPHHPVVANAIARVRRLIGEA
jgi:(p)ppGpp synthase/HD superfamily hydrolase